MRLGLVILAACGLLVAGCGGSTVNVTEEVAAEFGASADCREAGFDEVAGEREQVYSCSYRRPSGVHKFFCVAVMEGELYVVREDSC